MNHLRSAVTTLCQALMLELLSAYLRTLVAASLGTGNRQLAGATEFLNLLADRDEETIWRGWRGEL